MNQNHVSNNIAAYVAWKQNIIHQLALYRRWLNESQLETEEIDEKLDQVEGSLQRDNITIAFVGEFSRGKTELINSLFFAQYGQRLLPSRAGRTTMCPAELFFDISSRESYIKLLPIETRKNPTSIRKLKQEASLWVTLPLELGDVEKMQQTMSEVARCKSVDKEEAELLGFSAQFLDLDIEHPGNVLVPAWRHAIISFDHPLLRQGLTIIDTPGLNALGSEPELTFSLLPEAHAMLFMLSADTGITNSDLEIWRNHIKPYCNHLKNNFYAVINKIDTLWDDPDEPEMSEGLLAPIIRLVQQQLEMPAHCIIPISAKQALLGKLNADEERVERSNINTLENILSDHIVAKKEESLQLTVVNYILKLVNISRRSLVERLGRLEKLEEYLAEGMKNHKGKFDDISSNIQQDEKAHHQALLLLRSSQNRIKKIAAHYIAPVTPMRFDLYIKSAADMLAGSWTRVGIEKAIENFFEQIFEDFFHLKKNFKEANDMIAQIFTEYNQKNGTEIPFMPFNVETYENRLNDIQKRSRQSHRHFISVLKSHKQSSEQFFNAIVAETQLLYESTHCDAQEWCRTALLPILKSAQARKKFITTQLQQLRELINDNNSTKDKLDKLHARIKSVHHEIAQLNEIIHDLQRPTPSAQHLNESTVSTEAETNTEENDSQPMDKPKYVTYIEPLIDEDETEPGATFEAEIGPDDASSDETDAPFFYNELDDEHDNDHLDFG